MSDGGQGLHVPGYWMNETSGRLASAVEAYYTGTELSAQQCADMHAYLTQWMAGSGWQGREAALLRQKLAGAKTSPALFKWLDEATQSVFDPL